MENRTYLPVDREIRTEGNIGKYGESVAAYEAVLAGEAWPDNFLGSNQPQPEDQGNTDLLASG